MFVFFIINESTYVYSFFFKYANGCTIFNKLYQYRQDSGNVMYNKLYSDIPYSIDRLKNLYYSGSRVKPRFAHEVIKLRNRSTYFTPRIFDR
jgi:hypothetical protein